jgi:hypothetical protein
MKTQWQKIILFGSLALFLSACGPSDYDECVLESMKGVNNDVAARAITMSCWEKFPYKKTPDSELPADALKKLTGHAGNNSGRFAGNIYNGNTEWTITQVTIWVLPKSVDDVNVLSGKKYNTSVIAEPLTSSSFYFSLDGSPSEEYSWNIVKARGIPPR